MRDNVEIRKDGNNVVVHALGKEHYIPFNLLESIPDDLNCRITTLLKNWHKSYQFKYMGCIEESECELHDNIFFIEEWDDDTKGVYYVITEDFNPYIHNQYVQNVIKKYHGDIVPYIINSGKIETFKEYMGHLYL